MRNCSARARDIYPLNVTEASMATNRRKVLLIETFFCGFKLCKGLSFQKAGIGDRGPPFPVHCNCLPNASSRNKLEDNLVLCCIFTIICNLATK